MGKVCSGAVGWGHSSGGQWSLPTDSVTGILETDSSDSSFVLKIHF